MRPHTAIKIGLTNGGGPTATQKPTPIAAAHNDRDGYYNLHAKIEEAPNAPWWVFGVGRSDDNMSTYEGGCREFARVFDKYEHVEPHHLVYKARAFIKDETTGASDGEYNQDGMVMED